MVYMEDAEMAILATAKVTKDFRLTVPKEVREYLNLEAGRTLVFFTIEGRKGAVCIRKG
ncbi:hypothetical protein CW702_00105 [Candidatus Bathyarchaeota archaeon]|nr:MAG: hypothetical protein CW702_00105 [Candidatus Bathyarchaeota archaeon]